MVLVSGLYYDQARYSEASELLARAIGILEERGGPDQPDLPELLELRAEAQEACHTTKGGMELRQRAAEIRRKLAADDEPPAEGLPAQPPVV